MENLAHGVVSEPSAGGCSKPMGCSLDWNGCCARAVFSGWRDGAHSRSIIWYMRPVQMMVPRDTNSLSARDAINISSRWAEPILDAHTAKTKIDAAWSLWDQPVCLNARSSLPRRFQSVGRNIAMTRNDVISSSIKEILSFDATDVQLGKCGCTGWPREGYSSQYSRPKRPTRRPMLMIIEN